VRILHLKKAEKTFEENVPEKDQLFVAKTGLRFSITLDMRKDHKTQKNFSSVVAAPRLHLTNNDSVVCFKPAFPTSELKVLRPTYF